MRPAQICERVENWLMIKTKLAIAKGAVVGMSGGVDSSVVAVLAKRALGDSVLGLILPCDSNPEDAERAMIVAQKFGIRTQKIDLTPAYHVFRELMHPDKGKADRKILGNLKSRLRMCALYYFANQDNLLVLGTSNKSEMAIGYFTKHGDSAADLEPIGNLYKTDVLDLARYLDIPEEIIKAMPTAGLWEGQTDESEIGMAYIELDAILKAAENNRDIETGKRRVDKLMEMVRKSAHKRQMPEVCKF